MISITSVNWADLSKAAGDAGFDPVPAGNYDVVIDNATAKPASSGKNMIVTKFKIESGPLQGRMVFNNFVLSPESPNALAFFFRHMAAMGLGNEYFAANPSLERVSGDLNGRRCTIQVSVREWNGTQRNQVDNVLPPAGGPQAPAHTGPSGLPGISPAVTSAPGLPAHSGPPVPHTPTSTPAPVVNSPAGAPLVIPPPPPPPPAPPIGDDDLPF